MLHMLQQPFYDPTKIYDENFDNGPFGAFTDGAIYTSKILLQYEFLGYKVNLPFGIPAGPVLNSWFANAAFEKGFDIVHYKTQRSVVFPVNEFPNVLFLDVEGDLTLEKASKPIVGKETTDKSIQEISITNSFGNPSRGPDFWVPDMKKAVESAGKGQLLVASVVGTIKPGFSEEEYYDDFAYVAHLAKNTGVKVIEVNLSCPNVANEEVLCYTPRAVEAICKKTREVIGGTKLLAKVGYYSKEQQVLLEEVVEKIAPFIDGIAAINTIAAPVVDEEGKQALPGPNRLKSGICGASVKWAGLDMVRRLKEICKKLEKEFAIIGVGGVMTPEDYFKYRKIGADVVESATGAMWNPYLAQEIKERVAGAFSRISSI